MALGHNRYRMQRRTAAKAGLSVQAYTKFAAIRKEITAQRKLAKEMVTIPLRVVGWIGCLLRRKQQNVLYAPKTIRWGPGELATLDQRRPEDLESVGVLHVHSVRLGQSDHVDYQVTDDQGRLVEVENVSRWTPRGVERLTPEGHEVGIEISDPLTGSDRQ